MLTYLGTVFLGRQSPAIGNVTEINGGHPKAACRKLMLFDLIAQGAAGGADGKVQIA